MEDFVNKVHLQKCYFKEWVWFPELFLVALFLSNKLKNFNMTESTLSDAAKTQTLEEKFTFLSPKEHT